jgi:hypothetical protein
MGWFPETPPARETRYSLRVPVIMHVLRLARTFRTPDEFRETVATRGAVTVLSGIDPGSEELVSRLLDAMVWRDELCPGKPRVHVSSVDGAVAQGRRPETLLFDQFCESFGHALEHGQPILVPGARAALTARPSGLHIEELEADIAGLLAGRAAERLMLGRPSGGAGGQEDSDIAEATRRAVAIELSLGLGESGPLWHGSPERGIERLRFDRALQARVRARLDAAEDHATTVLIENRSLLTSMATELARSGALSGDLLQTFLDSVTAAATEKAGANPAFSSSSHTRHSTRRAETEPSLHERRKHTGQTETDIRVARQNTTLSALLNSHFKLVATTKRTANLVVETCIFKGEKVD